MPQRRPFLGACLSEQSEDGSTFLILPYGEPKSWAVPSRSLTKDETEVWHLGQLASDLFRGTGIRIAPFGARKTERPDFQLISDNSSDGGIGVEFASFTLGPRRAIEARMKGVWELIEKSPAPVSHLAGCHVIVSCTKPVYSKMDLDKILKSPQAVFEALSNLERPAPHDPARYVNGFPQEIPDEVFATICLGDVSLACYEIETIEAVKARGDALVPEVTPTFQVQGTIDDFANEFYRIVSDHNYPGIHKLVIVVGGPNERGFGYAEDEAVLRAVIENDPGFSQKVAAENREILIHWWSDGCIQYVSPMNNVLSPPLAPHQRMSTIVIYEEVGEYRLVCAEVSDLPLVIRANVV